jgi:hypothetical protein
MKTLFYAALLAVSCTVSAQVKLSDKDFKDLASLAEYYVAHNNANNDDFDASVKKFASGKLANMVQTMTLLDGGDKKLLTPKYMARPANDELQLWYTIDRLRYHKNVDTLDTRTNEQVLKAALAEKADEREMLDDYYRMLEGGIGFLFNEANLSDVNLEIDKLGFKNDTEKAIFFLNVTSGLIMRFRVLNQMQNPDKLMEYAAKLPKFNGEPYYKFKGFGFEDFEHANDVEKSTYKTMQMEGYYSALASHFMAASEKQDIALAKDIYFSSILYTPEFFKYSGMADMLQEVYNEAKN